MAEEQRRCQEPLLCINNCGFFGSPATENLCSKCYRDLHQSKLLNQPLSASSSSSASSTSFFTSPSAVKVNAKQTVVEDEGKDEVNTESIASQQQKQPNKCLTCRKRVGLTGFQCRCGKVFCGSHRYPEQHGCDFDFKTSGKQQIAKANPLVKGEKLEKI